jgi:hypothetical protein
MNKLLTCLLASAFLAGCATANTAGETTPADAARNAPKEDFVTGSRLRRSESMENYQGTRGTTREDYQQYKAPTSRDGGG